MSYDGNESRDIKQGPLAPKSDNSWIETLPEYQHPQFQPAKPQPAAPPELLPCPFCGQPPTIEPWHGGPKSKRMISCENVYCDVSPQVTGNTARKAIERWNTRHRDDLCGELVERLKELIDTTDNSTEVSVRFAIARGHHVTQKYERSLNELK